VLIRCREGDRKLVESLIEEAKKEYSEKANVQVPKITLDDRVYLPPPPKNAAADSHEPFWYLLFSQFLPLADYVCYL